MSLYSYQATNYKGEVIKGTLEASDESVVVDYIQSENLIPIKITKSSALSFSFSRKKINYSTLAVFTVELSTLLGAGLPLDRSLSILIGMEETDEWRQVLTSLSDKVKSGSTLSDAMKSHNDIFSNFYISMISAGEISGSLNVVLERLAETQEKNLEIRASVKKALFYPVLLVVVGIIIVSYLLLDAVPKFEEIISKNKSTLPFISDVVFALSHLMRSYWYLVLGFGLLLFVWIRYYFKNPNNKSKIDYKLLKLPQVGSLIRKLELVKAARTLGTMLTHGVPLVIALRSVRETVSNKILSDVLETAMSSLKSGRGMANVLIESKEFPSLGVQMIKVGEETGKLEEMLIKVANIYDKEVKSSIDSLIGIIGPLAILVIALFVAFIMIGVVMAIMSLS